MLYNSNLTSKGQVTIPANIRRRLGLQPGEPVRFRVTAANQVVIEKNDWKENLSDLHREVATHLHKHKIKPLDNEQLDRAIDQAAIDATAKEEQGSAR